MAINTELWGTPEEWQNISSSTWVTQANCKIPKSGRTSYYNAFNAGALEAGVVPTDLSLAFWGIGKGSILAHPMYLSSYWDGETIKTAANEVQTPNTVPCILNWTSDPSSTQANMQWSYRYAPTDNPGESNFNINNLLSNAALARTVIISFNYQNIFLIPFVKVAKAASSAWATATISLKEYIDSITESGTYSTYDKVLSIGYQIAIGDGIDNNRSTGLKEMGLTFPVAFEGSQRSYQNGSITYTWFATRYGINAFMTNLALNSYTHSLSPYYEWSAEDFSSLHLVGDADTGWRRKYCKNYYAGGNIYGQVPIYYYNPDDEIWKLNDSLPWNTAYANPFPYIECTQETADAVKDYVLKQIAFLGFPFIYDPTLAARGQIGDVGVYLPEFDTNGVTTGEYSEGRAALRLPNSEWTDGRTGSGYDPTRKPGEEDFGDLTNRRPTRVSPGGLNLYVTNYQTIYNLQRYLNGAYTPSAADLTADFKGTNPGDYIVSAFKFPVALPASQTLEEIYIGKIPSGFQAYRLTDNAYLDFGTIDIDPYFSTTIDFRDYQSKILLLMPFIGTAELDPKVFIGHSLSLTYNVDYVTGSVAAEIKRDGLTIETRTAKLAQTVPFFAGNMGAYQNELAQTSFAIEQSKIKQITGAVTTMFSIGGAAATAAGGGSELAGLGSGAGIIRGASNMLLEHINQESLEYRLEHTQPQIGTISTASAGNAFLLDDRARVLIWRPYMLPGYDPETYSHVVGNATLRAAALSEFSGYTVAAAAELSNVYTIDGTKSASEQELKLIKQALLAGVYV